MMGGGEVVALYHVFRHREVTLSFGNSKFGLCEVSSNGLEMGFVFE